MLLSNRIASVRDHTTSYASDSPPEIPKATKAARASRPSPSEPLERGGAAPPGQRSAHGLRVTERLLATRGRCAPLDDPLRRNDQTPESRMPPRPASRLQAAAVSMV